MNWSKTMLICLVILFVGGAFTTLIFFTEPTAKRTDSTKRTAMLVTVKDVTKGDYTPTVNVVGTVEPAQDIVLSSRVDGEITELSEAFAPGGYVEKGEKLLQIDPEDYRNELMQRKSELQQARADLNIEMGRQQSAQREYKMFGDTLSLPTEQKELVLRQPQLSSAKSRVQSAQAAVNLAQLNLERTSVEAPFNAHILTRNVNVGSQVARGDNLGRLVGLNEYWVMATVPLSQLRWLSFPEDGEKGSKVRIRNRTAWAEGEYREGYLYRLVGTLESDTRMAKVIVSVPDPMAHREENDGLPPLMIGAFVEASIQAQELEDVIRLERDYVRQGDRVWLMENGKLSIRGVDIVFRDANYAYIKSGLGDSAQVVTTNLSTVVDGAPLRLDGESSSDSTAVEG